MLNSIESTAYLGLGSNLGDGRATLQDGWQALGAIEGIVLDGLSSPYMTAPVDMTSQHWFTNAVGRLKVSLEPLQLLQAMFEVEASFGRTREEKVFGYQDRSLDLDLLYFSEVKMDTPELVLPHPRIGERLFVLVPFAELEPDFKDFACGTSIKEMIQRLDDSFDSLSRKKQEIIHGSWNA